MPPGLDDELELGIEELDEIPIDELLDEDAFVGPFDELLESLMITLDAQ